MPTWDPALYLRFERERGLPVRDLIGRLSELAPRAIVDLGCGPGTSTGALRARWPAARTTAVDSAEEMLVRARASDPGVDWVLGDLRTFRPSTPVDLVFANAVLQWVPDHAAVLPRLVEMLGPGGALAVQMPLHTNSPAHAAVREVAAYGPWADRLVGAESADHVAPPAEYYRIVAPIADRVELWQTEYLHVLDGPGGIVDWLSGTTLRPHLERLPEGPDRAAFLTEVERRIAVAYPTQPDGRVLFPFRRQFVVAWRSG